VRQAVAYLDVDYLPDGVALAATERAGVAAALTRIAAGEADTLIVARLHSAAASLPQLISLLDWLAEARADLIALDVELDTATQTGRRMVALLRDVEGWDRDRPRGRPGLAALKPHVAERIAELRERGLGLKAIADALNAEGVPTPRGGAHWRPSSVQAALGYRRPRPPAPGAPPPPPPPAPPGGTRRPGPPPPPRGTRRHGPPPHR
jgi:DNA invertase Pin-like site-specific DNA recombinase